MTLVSLSLPYTGFSRRTRRLACLLVSTSLPGPAPTTTTPASTLYDCKPGTSPISSLNTVTFWLSGTRCVQQNCSNYLCASRKRHFNQLHSTWWRLLRVRMLTRGAYTAVVLKQQTSSPSKNLVEGVFADSLLTWTHNGVFAESISRLRRTDHLQLTISGASISRPKNYLNCGATPNKWVPLRCPAETNAKYCRTCWSHEYSCHHSDTFGKSSLQEELHKTSELLQMLFR